MPVKIAAPVVVVASLALGAAPASAQSGSEKVEEVNLDDLDEPAHDQKPRAPADPSAPSDPKSAGSTVVEEVKPEELAQRVPIPEYDTSPWLLIGPLLALLIVMWNVDWKDARVKQELTTRRQMKAPKVKAPPKENA